MLRRRFASVLALTLAACGRPALRAHETAVALQQARVAAPVMPAARARVPLPCLTADSLAQGGDSVVFSNQAEDEDSGDLVGTALHLVRTGAAWTGTVALAQGEAAAPDTLHDATVDSVTGDVRLAWTTYGKAAAFEGKLSCASLIGEFRWAPDVPPEIDTLPRVAADSAVPPAR